MKRQEFRGAIVSITFLLSACLNIEPALSGKAYDDYQKSIKPYGAHWIKEGMTIELRREDSWACGTAETIHAAEHVVFDKKKEELEKRPEDLNDLAAYFRLRESWSKCMQSKRYVYLGKCDERCLHP